MSSDAPHIVILGAGFAGLEAARALKNTPARVTLVDRNPYNLFQPLLYQVATGLISPDVVATPLGEIVGRQQNLTLHIGEVLGIEGQDQEVHFADGAVLSYDRLIIATGSQAYWHGHKAFARHAQALKSLEDAETIRAGLNGLARTMRQRGGASMESPARIAIVGGGPTGVELAGALVDQSRRFGRALFGPGLKNHTDVSLIEAGPELLPSYGGRGSASAARTLQRRGVKVVCNAAVEDVGAGGLSIGGQRQEADLILWTAGVKASPAAEWLNIATLADGRLPVRHDLSLEGQPHIFIAGDLAAIDGVPGLAPAAKQMGRHAGRQAYLSARCRKTRLFRYRDLGEMAVVADGAALARIGQTTLTGEAAWAMWLAVHLYFLPDPARQAEAAAAMITRAAVNPEPALARLPSPVAGHIRSLIRGN